MPRPRADPPTGPDTGFTRLRTPRLLIRRFQPADVSTFASYRSDPDLARYQSWDAPNPEHTARRFVESLADAHPDTPGSSSPSLRPCHRPWWATSPPRWTPTIRGWRRSA